MRKHTRSSRLGLLVAAALFACRPGPARAPTSGPAQAKRYAPFELASDASDPKVAQILGTSDDSSTLLPLQRAGERVLDIVTDARGEVARVRVAVAAGATASAAPGGAPALPLAAELAAQAAAAALGKSPGEYDWSVTASTDADAVGAALPMAVTAALTGAFLGSLTGATLDDSATVLATVLPDGSLAGAPGLPEAVEAMLARGKRRLGLPAGTSQARSSRTGRLVDLAALAKAAGAVAVPLADVAELYPFLSGERLPATAPLSAQQLALSPETETEQRAAYAQWQLRIAEDWAAMLELGNAPRVPAKIALLIEASQRHARAAETLIGERAWGAGIDRLSAAWALGSAAVTSMRLVDAVQLGHVDDALELLASRAEILEPAAQAIAELGADAGPSSGAQLVRLRGQARALRALAAGLGLAAETARVRAELDALRGRDLVELGDASTAQLVTSAVAPLLVAVGRAHVDLERARQALTLRDELTAAPTRWEPPAERPRGLAAWAARLGELLRPVQPQGTWDDAAAGANPAAYPEFTLAQMAALWSAPPAPLGALRARWGATSPAWRTLGWVASLASGQLAAAAHWEMSSLRARRDPLDGALRLDGSSASSSLAALPVLLASAERHARQAAHAAQVAVGAVPLALRLAYQEGRELAATGEPELQVRGLYELWWATELGRAAVQLGGGAR